MINGLQSQLVLARQVLASAESKSSMTQSNVYEAMSKLNVLRSEIESANDDAHKAFEAVQMIEADILADQADDSQFAKATKDADSGNLDLIRAIRSVANVPEDEKVGTNSPFFELSRLSESERQTVKNSQDYKSAKEYTSEVEQRVSEIRTMLFDQSKEWRDAKRTLEKARNEKQTETDKMKPVTIAAAHQKQQASNLHNVIENAKQIISQGELRLRQLGVKPSNGKYGKR